MDMTASGLSGQSGTQLTRTLERALEDAQLTGELKFSGRKLKEFPKFAVKYDLSDTVIADLSKNKLNEVPLEVCEWPLLERLDCYHNAIRSVPDVIITLQSLSYINLSRNSLTFIPAALCQLPHLQVLILANNKLVSLPEEIGHLSRLKDLDVSCNEITILPPHIGDLQQLCHFTVRRNLLVELPQEVCELHLVKLDISANRISVLPPHLRLMTSLEDLIIDNNPLTSPPAFLATRGKTHIFKYLENQAKKQGLFLDGELRKSSRKPAPLLSDLRFPNGLTPVPLMPDRRRCTVDSGYNTTSECSEKRSSQDMQDLGSDVECESRKLALRAAEQTKEQRRERDLQRRFPLVHDTRPQVPPPPPPNEPTKKVLDVEHSQAKPHGKQNEESLQTNRSVEETSPVVDPFTKRTYPQALTYREFKEAMRLQRSTEIYKRPSSATSNGEKSPASPVTHLRQPLQLLPQENGLDKDPLNNLSTEDEFRMRHKALMSHQRYEAAQLQRKLEEDKSRVSKEATILYTKEQSGASISRSPRKQPPPPASPRYLPLVNGGNPTESHNGFSSPQNNQVLSPTRQVSNHHLTMRREMDKAREEQELIKNLRLIIEGRLKVQLPEDLGSALVDGVVLCHLANNVCPHSVSSIHVPSPSVPKLTMAKCRKNVENFLEACRRIGVPTSLCCASQDILEERGGLVRVAITVQELVRRVSKPPYR